MTAPTAVVTGAAMGIGRAAAWLMAEQGVRVSAWDRDETALHALEREASSKGLSIIGQRVDVRNEDSVQTAAESCKTEFSTVRYLFNSAGIQTYGTVIDTTSEAFSETIHVNLFGHYYTAKHIVPLILEAGGGAIVNTTSAQALQCQENVLAYAASKGAILTMTKSMALDLASHGIRVNAIAPGSIDTPMLRKAAELFSPDNPGSVLSAWGAQHPLGRVGTAEEVARLVWFLLSEATFMTGTIVSIDGGLTSRLM